MLRFSSRSGLFDRALRFFNPRSHSSLNSHLGGAPRNCDRPFKPLSQNPQIRGGRGLEDLKGSSYTHCDDTAAAANFNVVPQMLGNLVGKMGFKSVKERVSPYVGLSFRSFIHSSSHQDFETSRNSMNFSPSQKGFETPMDSRSMNLSSSQKDFEASRNSRSLNYARGIIEGEREGMMGGSELARYSVENNADVVHIKMLRNNTFVTLTDSKGMVKIACSSGKLSNVQGGAKLSRYAAEATAEHVGRLARNMGVKSVVLKVNGLTYFKKKKQAIVAFKEGFSSRGDQNPIVYIEDTTRKAHNGCRLPKKRRV